MRFLFFFLPLLFLSTVALADSQMRVIIELNSSLSTEHYLKQFSGKPLFTHQQQITALIPSSEFSRYLTDPRIKFIQPDQAIQPFSEPTESESNHLLRANFAHREQITGKGVKMAVLDSGFSAHDNLEISCVASPSYEDCEDRSGHGTHVTGIIAAKGKNKEMIGVSPDADVMMLKVLEGREGYTSDLIWAINEAMNRKVAIINMSLGGSGYDVLLHQVIQKAKEQGIIIVAAAGNNGSMNPEYPAAFEEVIAVSSINSQYDRSSFSSYGPHVDFSAPGEQIVSTYPNHSYQSMSGTSMASPFVAGVISLWKEIYPDLSSQELLSRIKKEALDLGVKGFDEQYGHGLIQAPGFDATEDNMIFDGTSGNGFVELNWENNQSGVVLYQDYQKIKVLSPIEYGLKINNLMNYKKYRFHLLDLDTRKIYRLDKTPELSKPTGFTVNYQPNHQVLRWTPTENAARYYVYIDNQYFMTTLTNEIKLDFTHHISYFAHVVSVSEDNNQSLASDSIEIHPKLFKPEIETIQPANQMMKLTWKSIIGARSYRIYKNEALIGETNQLEYSVSHLKNGEFAQYQLSASNSNGESDLSEIKIAAAKIDTPMINSVQSKNGSLLASWSSIPNAIRYEIYVNRVPIITTNENQYEITGLQNGQEYQIQVKAFDEYDASSLSNSIYETPKLSTPEAKFISVIQGKIKMAWKKVPNSLGYHVYVNQIRVNSELITTTTYILPATHDPITVKAVYSTHHESEPSNSLSIPIYDLPNVTKLTKNQIIQWQLNHPTISQVKLILTNGKTKKTLIRILKRNQPLSTTLQPFTKPIVEFTQDGILYRF